MKNNSRPWHIRGYLILVALILSPVIHAGDWEKFYTWDSTGGRAFYRQPKLSGDGSIFYHGAYKSNGEGYSANDGFVYASSNGSDYHHWSSGWGSYLYLPKGGVLRVEFRRPDGSSSFTTLFEDGKAYETDSDPAALSDDDLWEKGHPSPVDLNDGGPFSLDDLKNGMKVSRDEAAAAMKQFQGSHLMRFKKVTDDQYVLAVAVEKG